MSDDKKNSPHKRQYAVLSRQTIRTFAEAAGHGADMPDEIASVIAEDVVYRLRELVQVGCQYMQHCKRRKLTVGDFNHALLQRDCQPICGHGSSDAVQWIHIKEVDITTPEDSNIPLASFACNSELPTKDGDVTLQSQWMAVEGFQKNIPGANIQALIAGNKPRNLPEELQHHYELLTKAVLSSDPELNQIALDDLRTNTRIVPLLRNLVNFITNGIRKLNHDPCRLLSLLYAVNSLLRNKRVFLESQPYMAVLVDCVRHCAVEPLSQSAKSRFDQWILRDYAARLLAFMIQQWDSPVIKLNHQVTQGLNKILADPTKPFCSHYGAVSILTAIGAQSFEKCVLPHVVTLWPHLQTAIEDCSMSNLGHKMDAIRVCGAIQTGLLFLVRTRRSLLITQLGMAQGLTPVEREDPYEDCRKLQEVYRLSYNPCGDSLASQLPVESVCNVYFSKPLPEVRLGDDDSKKTGEELLQQFLPAVKKGRWRRSFEMGGDGEMGEDGDYDDDRSSDDLSFVCEEDLTIKATVSDPGRGIKLFIGKKSKSRLSEAESQDSEAELTKTAPVVTVYKKKVRSTPEFSDIFEWTKIRSTSIQFIFCYAGRIQRCKSTERRKLSVAEPPPVPIFQTSDFHKLSQRLPVSGRGKALTAHAKEKAISCRLRPLSLLTAML